MEPLITGQVKHTQVIKDELDVTSEDEGESDEGVIVPRTEW